MRYWDSHIFKGMMSDFSMSNQPENYFSDAFNIRIDTRHKETEGVVTNEKGPLLLSQYENLINGTYLGHQVLNNFVTVFTKDGNTDYIYRLYFPKENESTSNITIEGCPINLVTLLFQGNLGFDINYPMECLGVYENPFVQKVYWTDNLNQPRLINHQTINPQKIQFLL